MGAADSLGHFCWRKSSHSGGGADCVEVGRWRKSSHSGGNADCVEVGHWHKSSHSGGNANCVEVAPADAGTRVRDSKNPAGPHLVLTDAQWATFLAAIKSGRLVR